MSKLPVRNAAVAAAGLILGLLLYGACEWTFLGRLEQTAGDQLFRLRYRIWGPEPIDSRLLLVGIDEETFEHVGLPALLWQPYYGEVFRELQKRGAKVVALDIIFTPNLGKLDGHLLEQLLKEEMELAQLVTGGPFLLVEMLMEDGTTRGPTDVLATLARRPESGTGTNLTVANIVEDEDGTCRRLAVYQDSEGQVRNLYARLLEVARNKTFETRNGKLYFGDQELPTEKGPTLRVNYPAPPSEGSVSAFPFVSMADVLSQNIDERDLRGKICVIAPAADILQDFIATPYQPQALGVEAHLAVMNTVLTQRFITKPPVWPLILIVLSILGATLGQNLNPRKTRWALLSVQLVYLALAVLLFGWFGYILPLVSSFLALLLGGSIGYLERLRTVERDRSLIRSVFGKMVSPQVMEHVLDSPDLLLEGQEREVTVLFTDINNFTPICEKHTPPQVVKMLSDYFELMTRVILKNDGYIKQYVGDEIMVIFGAPKDQPDHARRAVITGLEILEELQRAEAQSSGPGFYDTKIGINTGPVVVGKVGSDERWEYAAVGDDVNLGARVMSLTKKLETKMLVSEKTQQAVGEVSGLNWVSRGEQSFKGKEQQLELFEVERSTADPEK